MAHEGATVPDLDQFFWSSVDLLSVFGSDGALILVNPAWHDVLGWDLNDLQGRPFTDFVHPDDLEATAVEFDLVINGPESIRREFVNRQRCTDGDFRWIEWSSRRNNGLISATGRDVTHRRAIQERLTLSAAMNDAMFEAAADSIVIIDSEFKIVESSPESERMYGYPETGRRGRTGLNIVHPEDRPRVTAALRHCFEVDEVVTVGFRAHHADGHEITLETRGRALRAGDNAAGLAVFITRDVTEAAAAQAALAESLTKLRAIIDTAVDAITVIDRDMTILEVSPAGVEMYGIPEAQRRGHRVLEFIHPEDVPVVEAAVRRIFEEGQSITARFRVLHADGHWLSVESRGRALENAGEAPAVAVVITRDVTETVEMAKALEIAKSEAERNDAAKSEFMSRMSHELRTPLNAVIGFSELLQMELDDPDVLEVIGRIHDSGHHLLALINEVLDISRIESGGINVTLVAVAVEHVVFESAAMVSAQAREHGVEMVIGSFEGLYVKANRQRLHQVLLNLLTNAIKYNRPQGRVTVSSSEGDGWVYLAVTDTGLGIAPELIERLFTPFDRLNAQSTGIEGTGLGLVLAKSLTEAMGGTLGVSSTLGEGSTFTIGLPNADGLDIPTTLFS